MEVAQAVPEPPLVGGRRQLLRLAWADLGQRESPEVGALRRDHLT